MLFQVKTKTLNPRWMEEFDLHFHDGLAAKLDIIVRDKDIGRDDHIGRYDTVNGLKGRETIFKVEVFEVKNGASVL